jgi:Tfp pilus assembly protein PilX
LGYQNYFLYFILGGFKLFANMVCSLGGFKMKLLSKQLIRCKKLGTTLIISLIFIIIFSALAVSLASLSTSNVQISYNYCKADHARAAAESGLEIIRQWLSNVNIPGTTPLNSQFASLAAGSPPCHSFQESAQITSNVAIQFQNSTITIPNITLNSAGNEQFSAVITPLPSATAPERLQIDITGTAGNATKTIRVDCQISERGHTVFDYGVATKGPLSLTGNIDLEGVNVAVEASVYIESENDNLALSIVGNSQIAGDVSIVNPAANVYLQGGKAGIGGETGQNAVNHHVTFGVPYTDFPIPNPGYFAQYTTSIINSSTNTSANATYENAKIVGGTNPNFTGNVILKGVLFVETPNVVTFSGNVNIIGLIVGNGDYLDDSGTNQIKITGNVVNAPVTQLPDEPQFAAIKNEKGTFMLAPGFKTSFGGNFHTLSGAIAANGITFFGNAGGTINGSVINYSEEEMTMTGNADLYFNRSGVTEVPAGFEPEIILTYMPASYSEIAGQ